MFSRGPHPLRSVYARARAESDLALGSDTSSADFRSSGLDFLGASVYRESLTLRSPCECSREDDSSSLPSQSLRARFRGRGPGSTWRGTLGTDGIGGSVLS
jgi:hypothetical protein